MKSTKYPNRYFKLVRFSEFIFSMIIGAMNVGIATNITGNQVQYLLRPIWRNKLYSSSDWFYTTKDLNFVFSWFTGMILSLGGMNFIIFKIGRAHV